MEFVLPFFAVLIGAGIALVINDHKSSTIRLLLSFSGSFLLAMSLFSLLPEVYEHMNAKKTGVLIMCGILLQIILEFFSKGAEHGHMHFSRSQHRFPLVLFISLALHSFLEGFPIHHHDSMLYGVLIHKIPIAILLTSYFLKTKLSRLKIAMFIILFALMTPLGAWSSAVLPLAPETIYATNALVIGIFLHISTTIIFESGDGHSFNLSKLMAIVAGIVVAYFI